MNQDLKARIFGILEPGDEDSKYFDPFIMGLILLNVAAVVLETVDSIYSAYAPLFDAFDLLHRVRGGSRIPRPSGRG